MSDITNPSNPEESKQPAQAQSIDQLGSHTQTENLELLQLGNSEHSENVESPGISLTGTGVNISPSPEKPEHPKEEGPRGLLQIARDNGLI